jgi:hypothetical protein
MGRRELALEREWVKREEIEEVQRTLWSALKALKQSLGEFTHRAKLHVVCSEASKQVHCIG